MEEILLDGNVLLKKNKDKFREKGECIGSIDIVNIFVLQFLMIGLLRIVCMCWNGFVVMMLFLFLKKLLFYRMDFVGFFIL